MKKFVLFLLVAATLTGTMAMPASAAESIQSTTEDCHAHGAADMSNWQRLGDGTDNEIYRGKIINSESGLEIVMQVNEDGSFATMPFSKNTYSAMASSKCQHPHWKQEGVAKYKGKVRGRYQGICYEEVYLVKYRCINPRCKTLREMKTYISYKHKYSNNRCISCGKRK